MEGLLCCWVVVALVSAFLGQLIAERREAGPAGSVCGLLFGPLGVIIAALLDQRRRCPACREGVGARALLCPHCRTALEWVETKQGQQLPNIHPDAPLARQFREQGIPFPGARAKRDAQPSGVKPTPPPAKPFGP